VLFYCHCWLASVVDVCASSKSSARRSNPVRAPFKSCGQRSNLVLAVQIQCVPFKSRTIHQSRTSILYTPEGLTTGTITARGGCGCQSERGDETMTAGLARADRSSRIRVLAHDCSPPPHAQYVTHSTARRNGLRNRLRDAVQQFPGPIHRQLDRWFARFAR
jgi:hypothetical protein